VNILALECSTEILSVAVYAAGELRERVEQTGKRHGDVLLPMIDAALADAGVDKLSLHAVAFGRGPGAFTGVRMAVAAAQGIAYGLDIPAIPVSSLAALAQEGFDRGAAPPMLALADARMGEVYAGFFDVGADGLVYAIGEERLAIPEALSLPGDDVWCVLGPGFHAYRQALDRALGYRADGVTRSCFPQASTIARLAARELREGRVVAAAQALPVYLRDKVAMTTQERRH
jgi:tRNA threonylcarbamoyladenosine biosynthesis protein TsaB